MVLSGSGSYEHWLEIQRLPKPETQDSMGVATDTPELLFETWGAFEPIGSREFPEAQKRHNETTARFRIPYPDYTLDPQRDRVMMVFDDTVSPINSSTWNILGALPAHGQRFELLLEVSEVK
jgi:hypothetical protein